MTGCAHCTLPLPARPVVEEARAFCCEACAVVFAAIRGAGLESYYQRREQAPVAPPQAATDMAWYSRPEVQARYARGTEERLEVSLLVDGMHCAACCWLVERALGDVPGVHSARVNFATSRLRVSWDPRHLGLGDVMARVALVGYRPTPYDPDTQEAPRSRASNDLLLRMAVAGFCAGNIMLISAALYAGYFSGIEESFKDFFHWVSLLLALPVMLFSARPFFMGALRALRGRMMNMDVPITIGVSVTFAYSVWATLTGRGEVYFDTVANFMFVLLIGRLLELNARGRVAGTVERVLALGARTAVVVTGGERREVAVEELVAGDLVEVTSGCRIPVDGVVVEGQAWVDQSMLTGESLPVAVAVGGSVSGGTVVVDGVIRARAQRTGSHTVLAQIARLVEDAQSRRAPVQRIADRAAAWFVAVTLLLAGLTFVLWQSAGLERAMMIAVSVLIITCPCALGLATPLAVSAVAGRAAGRGVLFRGGDVMEALTGVDYVLLDKTGTLTEGRLALVRTFPAPGQDAAQARRLAAAVEQMSVHPLARALCAAVPGALPHATSFEAVPGRGVAAVVEGRSVVVGTEAFLRECGVSLVDNLAADCEDHTVVWLGVDGAARAVFALADRLRPEAAGIVQALRARGLRVAVASGDRSAVVSRVAAQVGVDEIYPEMLPQDKQALVERLQASGRRVAMVGDGVNDAPALVSATVGVAVASGADVSVEAADLVLLRPGLDPLLEGLRLADLMMRTVRDNMTLSMLYNTLAIPSAMAGFIAPVVAAVAMPVSGLLVVGNCLRAAHVDGAQPRPPRLDALREACRWR